MKKLGITVTILLCVGLSGMVAQAATVHFELYDYMDGTLELYASASLGDNAGISFFNVDLVDILTGTHQSPKGVDMDAGFITRGFTGGAPDLAGDGALFAFQNTLDAPTLIYGIGQTAGTFNTAGSPRGVPWAAPVLIASGTYSLNPANPDFGPEAVANVFTTDGEVEVEPATVTTHVTRVPEPVTLTMLGLGGLGVLIRRRR